MTNVELRQEKRHHARESFTTCHDLPTFAYHLVDKGFHYGANLTPDSAGGKLKYNRCFLSAMTLEFGQLTNKGLLALAPVKCPT
jgi:hypothetical protein